VLIGVLDQSPVLSGTSATDAVRETVYLAQMAEDLGYHRYWLAEHHSIAALADPCPEILLARIGAATKRIRIGTGGILMPYYSPLKIAEVFRMLEALYPGRMDLGLGRAPGGDMRTAQAMAGGRYLSAEGFPQQVQDLMGFLDGSLAPNHPFARVKAMPAGPTQPEIWLLGSSDYSGLLAAQLGTRFAFAHFISAHGGDAVARAYRARFAPSGRLTRPYAAVCVFVICAPTREQAERLAKAVDLRRLHMARGIDAPVPTLEEAERHVYDPHERAYVQEQRARLIHGDPGQVRERLLELKESFQADEMLVLTSSGDAQTRRLSYRLVAETFSQTA
jgi:luciferase family oxidoreductase group 1